MYVQMIGGICGDRVIRKDNKNGNSLDTGIHSKLSLIRLVAFMAASFIIYFTLGGFGSPEKDWGFVLLLFVVTVYFFLDGLP